MKESAEKIVPETCLRDVIQFNKVLAVHLPSGTWTLPVQTLVSGDSPDSWVLNRNNGGYFHGLNYVVGEITGTWQGRIREAVCAMIGTWSPNIYQVWVGTSGIIPGENVDVVSLDANNSVALIEAKGPTNVSASIEQFQNSAYQLWHKYSFVLQAYAQILVISNGIDEPNYGVKPDGGGYCILTYMDQPVICNNQYIWVVFTKVSEDKSWIKISSQGTIPSW